MPNIAELRNKEAETNRNRWQNYLIKTRDQQKNYKKIQKNLKEELDVKIEKREEKFTSI